MWDVDTKYRQDLEQTFTRLLDKLEVLNAARPLPNIVLQNIGRILKAGALTLKTTPHVEHRILACQLARLKVR